MVAFKNLSLEQGLVAEAQKSYLIEEAKAGGSGVQGQPRQFGKTILNRKSANTTQS